MKAKLLLIFFSFLCLPGFASWFASGFITYKHIKGNQFEVIYQTIRDCRGVPLSGTFRLTVYDSYNKTYLNMNRTSIENVSINHPNACSPTNSPANQGAEKHTFTCLLDLDTLASGTYKSVCKIYMGVDFCCRNGAINTYAPGNGFVECMMDRCYIVDNSGPDCYNLNIHYFAANQTQYFNPIVFDSVDNDILEYNLATPLNDFNSPETFSTGYSAAYPISPFCTQSGQKNCSALPLSQVPRGLYNDSLNGNMIFTPTNNTEVGSLVYKINEFRYINGVKQLIGYYYVDQEFVVQYLSAKNAPIINKNTLKLNHYFTAGKTQTIHFVTQENDTATADSVLLYCINPIDGSSVSIQQKWRPECSFTWTPKCEDIRTEPYIFSLYFYNENQNVINMQSIAFNVFVQSDLNLGADTLICKNGTFKLSSSIIGHYKWNGNLSDSLSYFTAHSAGKYYVDITRNNCVVSDTINLTEISTLPEINLGPDTIICNQLPNAVISISAAYDYFVKYNWNVDSSNRYSFLNFKDTGWVILNGSNVCGTKTDSIHIERMQSPFMQLPDDTLICNALSFKINPIVSGKGRYLWNDYSVDSIITVDSSGKYYLNYYNACGSDHDSIEIAFQSFPLFSLGSDTIICDSNFPLFDLSHLNASVLWSDLQTDPKFKPVKDGILWAKAENQCGVFSDTIVIQNIHKPNINIGRDTMICLPFELDLKSTCDLCQYLWSDNTTDSILKIKDKGMYFLEAHNQCGIQSDSIVIQTDSIPYFKLPSDTAFKTPFSFLLKPDRVLNHYYWSNGDTSAEIQIQSAGKYYLRAVNYCGEFSDTIVISELSGISHFEAVDILCYPNPVQSHLWIETALIIREFNLYNSEGKRIVHTSSKDASSYDLDLSRIPKGIYLLEIIGESDTYLRTVIK